MKLNLNNLEFMELLPLAFGLSEEETEELLNDDYDPEEWLHNKLTDNHHDSLADMAHALISGLMPMIFVGRSPLTNTLSKGFGVGESVRIRKICGVEIEEEQ